MQRMFPWILAGCLCVTGLGQPGSAAAQTNGAYVADLHQQLKSGLKARRPLEFAFIAKVVMMVENDTLPLDLVMSTFLWTRKNPKAKDYPFVYFQQALRERAKKLGIEL